MGKRNRIFDSGFVRTKSLGMTWRNRTVEARLKTSARISNSALSSVSLSMSRVSRTRETNKQYLNGGRQHETKAWAVLDHFPQKDEQTVFARLPRHLQLSYAGLHLKAERKPCRWSPKTRVRKE